LHFQLFQTIMPNHLLFLAHTDQQVAECRYFLLKYLAVYNLKPPANTTVVVYTHQPTAFEGFTSFITAFQMPVLPGTPTSKTALLHEFLSNNTGNVLYCDTATYPLQPLEALFADIEKGSLYLHAPHRHKESELHTTIRKLTALRDKTATATATPEPRINVWHAAVIGLNDHFKNHVEKLAQQQPATALDTDYNYTKQFGESGKIKSAGKYLFDYGGFEEFSQLLQTFFKKNEEESIPNQIKLLHHIDAAAIQQQKRDYHQQPLFKKWLQAITGKRWSIRQYENRL
jgi:hypothetical protein